MSTDTTNAADSAQQTQGGAESAPPQVGAHPDTPRPGEELGDAGTAAIKAARGERDKAKAQLRDYQALGSLQELQERLTGQQTPPEPVDPEQAATERVAAGVRRAELKAAAAGAGFHNLDDVLIHATPDQLASITVDDRDHADPTKVAEVVAAITAQRPYLLKPQYGDYRASGIGAVGSGSTAKPTLADGYRARAKR